MKKTTVVDTVSVTRFNDGSVLLETASPDSACVALDDIEARRIARALSPLYVVKSAAGCYASYDSVEDVQEVKGHTVLAWTEDRSKAVHFTTREAARAVARGCWPSAGARVVRVKR